MPRLAFVLLAAACSADVDLELDGRAPDIPPAPLPDPSLGELDWSFTDPGLGGSETMHVDRAPDGSVIAAGHFSRYDGLPGFDAFLARLSADGAPMWVAEIERQDLIDLIGGFGDRVVVQAWASIESIAGFDDGRTLVALTLEVGLVLADGLTPGYAELGFLRWYDRDGNLIDTRRVPGGDDSPSAPDQTLPRTRMSSLVTLPDGGGVYASLNRGGPDERSDIVRFDAEGNELWTTSSDGSDFVTGLTPTSDGGIVFHGGLVEQVTVGDRTLRAPGGGAFVARLDLDDGRCSWLTSFDDAHQLLFRGGIGLAAGGRLVATGLYTYRVRAGGLEIETTEHGNKSFVSVLGPDGDVLSLTSIARQHPGGAAMEGRYLDSASVGDDTVLLGGRIIGLSEGPTVGRIPAFVAVFDLDGQLLAERRLEPGADELTEASAMAVTIMPDGGVLTGGFWLHEIDFGDGAVLETGEPNIPQLFIALYHPLDDDTTVDRITRGATP